MNKKKERTLFADNFKSLRHFKQMSVPQFAKLLGIDSKRASEVERGRLLPNSKEVKAVEKEFGISKHRLNSSLFQLSLKEFSEVG